MTKLLAALPVAPSWRAVLAWLLLVLLVPAQSGVGDEPAKRLTPEQRAELEEKADDLADQAIQFYRQARYKEASQLAERVLELRRALYPKSDFPRGHQDLALSLNNLGYLLRAQGEYERALPYLQQALAMYQALYPKSRHPGGNSDFVHCLNNLGLVHQDRGEYPEALKYHQEALTMCRLLYPRDRYPDGHADLAASLTNMGSLLWVQGEYQKTLPYLQQALAMYQALYPRSRYPQGYADLAASLNNLGSLLHNQGEYQKALPYYQQALEMRQALYPKSRYVRGHPDLASSLNSLGRLFHDQGEYRKALPYLQQALEMYRGLFPKERYPQGHPLVALSLNNVGGLLAAQQEFEKARPYCQQALEMHQALYPKDRYPKGNSLLAHSLNNLGMLLQAQGEYEKALPYLQKALAMDQVLYAGSEHPPCHPNLASSLHNLGGLYLSQGDHKKALEYFQQALRMSQDLTALFADAASEAEALNRVSKLPATRDLFLSLQPHLAAASGDDFYASVWRGRSALTRIVQRRQQIAAARATQDEATRRLSNDLLSTRRQLARLLLAPASGPRHEQRLQEFTERKEELERRLARRLPGLLLSPEADQSSHQQLAACLPRDAAFIDVIRFIRLDQDLRVPGQKGERRTECYVAFVVRPGIAVRRIDLGAARPIEEALADWRQAVADWQPELAGKSRKDNERQAAVAAERLRRLVWDKWARELGPGTRTVYLAPDGALSRLPWIALPGSQEKTVLLEELNIALVPHGQFLLAQLERSADKRGPETGALLTVSRVAYGERPKRVPGCREEAALLHSPERGTDGGHWLELPATADEVSRIRALAGRRRVKSLTGKEAGTDQLLQALPQARWAHLATHGFFADSAFRSVLQIDAKAFDYRGIGDRGTAGARNPLVLSGLALAGANLPRPEDQDELTYDSGILTAEALAGLPLQGLDLAVMSACDTGLGDVAGGEGVYGLQRAFHLAGTRNVVASLWKVNDEATAALMAVFYYQLWHEGKPPLEALRQAQLTLYHHPERIGTLARDRGFEFDKVVKLPPTERPRDPKAPPAEGRAAVKLWAGFVLSGPGN
jgi:CHAT domain-containing protein/tetratricopeptide (TPR) repeat protein